MSTTVKCFLNFIIQFNKKSSDQIVEIHWNMTKNVHSIEINNKKEKHYV
jgi:hypothetical protein